MIQKASVAEDGDARKMEAGSRSGNAQLSVVELPSCALTLIHRQSGYYEVNWSRDRGRSRWKETTDSEPLLQI